MSATIESDLFSMYFAVPVRGRVEGAPVVSVDGKSFHVVESYLDDLRDIGVRLCLLSVLKSEQILVLERHLLKECSSVSKTQGIL